MESKTFFRTEIVHCCGQHKTMARSAGLTVCSHCNRMCSTADITFVVTSGVERLLWFSETNCVTTSKAGHLPILASV